MGTGGRKIKTPSSLANRHGGPLAYSLLPLAVHAARERVRGAHHGPPGDGPSHARQHPGPDGLQLPHQDRRRRARHPGDGQHDPPDRLDADDLPHQDRRVVQEDHDRAGPHHLPRGHVPPHAEDDQVEAGRPRRPQGRPLHLAGQAGRVPGRAPSPRGQVRRRDPAEDLWPRPLRRRHHRPDGAEGVRVHDGRHRRARLHEARNPQRGPCLRRPHGEEPLRQVWP